MCASPGGESAAPGQVPLCLRVPGRQRGDGLNRTKPAALETEMTNPGPAVPERDGWPGSGTPSGENCINNTALQGSSINAVWSATKKEGWGGLVGVPSAPPLMARSARVERSDLPPSFLFVNPLGRAQCAPSRPRLNKWMCREPPVHPAPDGRPPAARATPV